MMNIGRLTPQEITHYRHLLEKLDRKAHEPGGDPSKCKNDIWQFFTPPTLSGIQIYKSFSDEELLDIVVRTMDRPGHKPDFKNIYCIYLCYLKARFGGLNEIKALARKRMKQQKNARDWPVDWQEHVSIEPILKRMERSKTPLSQEEIDLLERLCTQAKESGIPIHLDEADKRRLDRMGGSGSVLKMMGIPTVKGSELRHLQQYWETEKEKKAASTERQKGKES